MKDKKNESILTPILLIILIMAVVYIITPGLDGLNKMFDNLLKGFDKSDPTAMAIIVLVAVIGGALLAVIADMAHKK